MPDLHDLLTLEADGLDVPAPPARDILQRAKGVRRRRRLVTGVASVAAATVVAGAATWGLAGGDDGTDHVAGAPGTGPVFAAGTTLFYGDGSKTVQIDDKAVKSLFYTSAGVLVRHGDNPYSDGGGPQRFTLVTPSGEVHPLGLVTEETVHATDPEQPYVAYAENVDGTVEVVVYDVVEDREAARVPVTDAKDSWFPVSIDGDTVYVQSGYDGDVYAVDWRTGEVTRPATLDSVWEVHGGVVGDTDGGKPVVRDVASGDVLLTADRGSFEVAPDGRYARLVDSEKEFQVYDVATGDAVTIDGHSYDWAWTTTDQLFKVGDDQVTTCAPDTGRCTSAAVDIPDLGTVPGEKSTSTQLMPKCEFEVPKNLEPGETWSPTCPADVDCDDPAQRDDCMTIRTEEDSSFQEEIILGGQVRES